jgi:hypothetical protein
MNSSTPSHRATRRRLPATGAALFAVAIALSQSASAAKVTPPSVPFELQPDEGSRAFLVGHAFGTQNYVCVPSATAATGDAYALFTPEATLYDADGGQIITHFFSPNPDPRDPNTNAAVIADGAVRPTWQQSHDGSSVWAKLHPNGSVIKDEHAIPWLLLDVVGREEGLDGGDFLGRTTQIQRLNTTGGLPPANGCSSPADLGHQAFVPYTADYFFYKHD